MLVVAYCINDFIKEGCGQVAMLVVTILMAGGNITWTVFQFINYSACGYNIAFQIVTIVFAVIGYVIVPFRTREDASILTTSVVWTYLLYLQWTALTSNRSTICNPSLGDAGMTTAKLVTGIFFSFVALFTVSAMTKKDGGDAQEGTAVAANEHLMTQENDGLAPVDDVEVGDKEKGETKTMTAEDQHVFPISTATIYFQLLMLLASIYLAMLLTNWGTPSASKDDVISTASFFKGDGNASFWMQYSAQWASGLIYIISLVAPLLCPDREF